MTTILFQGDSVTDCERKRNDDNWGRNQPGYGYALMTQGKMLCDHPDWELQFINRGVSGNRIVDLYARWKIDALNLKPEVICILIGVNDTWHEKQTGNGVELDRYEEVFRMLLSWTKKVLPQVKLVLLEPFIEEFGLVEADWLGEVAERGRIVRRLSDEFDAEFVPLQQEFDLRCKAHGAGYYFIDGVHPTIAGHYVITGKLIPALEKVLRK